MISFNILGKVKAKQSVKFTRDGRKYTPKDIKEYSDYLKKCFMRMYPAFEPLRGPLKVEIKVYMSVPKSYNKRKKSEALKGDLYPLKKPDCDNIAKNICDSLNEIAYIDDKQICELSVSKTYAEIDYVTVNIAML